MDDILVTDLEAGVRQITLNRPDALNAINHPMHERLQETFDGLKKDFRVRTVLLTGAGRAFTAGHDMRDPQRSEAEKDAYDNVYLNVLTLDKVGALIASIKALPQPVIAAIKGPVLADEALRSGLVLKVVPDDDIVTHALAIARQIALNAPLGVYMTKQALWMNMQGASLEQAIPFENRGVHTSQASEDGAEKLRAFQDKRPPEFRNR